MGRYIATQVVNVFKLELKECIFEHSSLVLAYNLTFERHDWLGDNGDWRVWANCKCTFGHGHVWGLFRIASNVHHYYDVAVRTENQFDVFSVIWNVFDMAQVLSSNQAVRDLLFWSLKYLSCTKVQWSRGYTF